MTKGRIYREGPLSLTKGHGKNADGWRIRGTLADGRQIDTTRATKAKAQSYAQALHAETEGGARSGTTMGDLIDAWWEAGVSDTDGPPWARNTQEQYGTYIRALEPWRNRPASTITDTDLRKKLAPYGPGAKRAAFKTWRACFSFGVKTGRIVRSPMAAMSEPNAKRTRIEVGEARTKIAASEIPTFELIHSFVDATPAHSQLAVETVPESGVRTGELFALRKRKVDGQRILVDEQWTGREFKLPKYEIVRHTVVSEAFAEKLERACHGLDDDDLVFTTPSGTMWNRSNWNRMLIDTAKKVGGDWFVDDKIRWTNRNMRHRYATRALSTGPDGWGLDVARASLLLGHSRIQTTLEYYVGHVSTVIDGIVEHLAARDR